MAGSGCWAVLGSGSQSPAVGGQSEAGEHSQCLNTFFKVVSGIHWKPLLANSTSRCVPAAGVAPHSGFPLQLPACLRSGQFPWQRLTSDFAAGLSRRRGKGEPEPALGEGLGQGFLISGPSELVRLSDGVPCSVILAVAVCWHSPWVRCELSSVEEGSDLSSCLSLVGFGILYLHRGPDVRSLGWQEPAGSAAPGSRSPTCPFLSPISRFPCPAPHTYVCLPEKCLQSSSRCRGTAPGPPDRRELYLQLLFPTRRSSSLSLGR